MPRGRCQQGLPAIMAPSGSGERTGGHRECGGEPGATWAQLGLRCDGREGKTHSVADKPAASQAQPAQTRRCPGLLKALQVCRSSLAGEHGRAVLHQEQHVWRACGSGPRREALWFGEAGPGAGEATGGAASLGASSARQRIGKPAHQERQSQIALEQTTSPSSGRIAHFKGTNLEEK